MRRASKRAIDRRRLHSAAAATAALAAVAVPGAIAGSGAPEPDPRAGHVAPGGSVAGSPTRDTPRRAKPIRGRFGYGLRRKGERGFSRKEVERIMERLDDEDTGRRHRSRGPFPGPRNPPTSADVPPYPFRPGRRSDDRKVTAPPYPAAGEGPPPGARVSRTVSRGTVVAEVKAEDFAFYRNQPVLQGYPATSPGEPSFANAGDVILYAGNVHAAVSEDHGITWEQLSLNSADASREPVDGGFAGDQVVVGADYEGQRAQRLIFWTMLYAPDETDNTIRLQVFHNANEIVDQIGQCTYDFKASEMGLDLETWIDQPRVAATDEYLYMMGTVYRTNETLVGEDDEYIESRIWRIRLSELAETDCRDFLEWEYYPNAAGASDNSPVPVQGADDVMYWAYLEFFEDSAPRLQVWRHEDDENTARLTSYEISHFVDAHGLSVCSTPGPTVSNPCGHMDSNLRPESGWIGKEDFGWFWGAGIGPDYDYPYMQGARFRKSEPRDLLEEPDIRNSFYAWVYGAIGVNERGDLGIVAYSIGGGAGSPTGDNSPTGGNPAAFAALIDDIDPGWTLDMNHIVTSEDGPGEDRWGDYSTVRKYDGCPNLFGGGVYSIPLVDLNSPGFNIEHRFVIFGRGRDACPDLEPLLPGWTLTNRNPWIPVEQGDAFFSRHVVRNTGPGQIPSSSTSYLLSRDLTRSGDDLRLEAEAASVPSLDTGDWAGIVARLEVPRQAAGSYTLLICSDASAGPRQISRSNDCAAAPDAVYVTGSSRDLGIRRFTLPQPAGRLQVPRHAVRPRGTVRVNLDLASRRSPRSRTVQFYLSRRARFSSRRARLMRELSATERVGAQRNGRRFAVNTRVRLPRSAAYGRDYQLIACVVGRRGARPLARNCLPGRQRILVKRR